MRSAAVSDHPDIRKTWYWHCANSAHSPMASSTTVQTGTVPDTPQTGECQGKECQTHHERRQAGQMAEVLWPFRKLPHLHQSGVWEKPLVWT